MRSFTWIVILIAFTVFADGQLKVTNMDISNIITIWPTSTQECQQHEVTQAGKCQQAHTWVHYECADLLAIRDNTKKDKRFLTLPALVVNKIRQLRLNKIRKRGKCAGVKVNFHHRHDYQVKAGSG